MNLLLFPLRALLLGASLLHLTAAEPAPAPKPGAGDFDFLHGRWQITNRKLLKPLSGQDEWETFTATNECWGLPGGGVNYDKFEAPTWRPGYVGRTIRVFSPETGRWSIFWLNTKTAGLKPDGQFDTPVVGQFKGDVGIFEGPDIWEGKPILVRYTWTRVAVDKARWEQAFSTDGGKTWETNWKMEQTRVGNAPVIGAVAAAK